LNGSPQFAGAISGDGKTITGDYVASPSTSRRRGHLDGDIRCRGRHRRTA
jgi:hypothetical protein